MIITCAQYEIEYKYGVPQAISMPKEAEIAHAVYHMDRATMRITAVLRLVSDEMSDVGWLVAKTLGFVFAAPAFLFFTADFHGYFVIPQAVVYIVFAALGVAHALACIANRRLFGQS